MSAHPQTEYPGLGSVPGPPACEDAGRRKSPSRAERDRLRMGAYNERKSGAVAFVAGETLVPSVAYIRGTDGVTHYLTPSPPAREEEEGRGPAVAARGRGSMSAVPPPINYEAAMELTKLRDRSLFDIVRGYLAYFAGTEDAEVVNGESRISSMVKIRSDGLPLGGELEGLYFRFLQQYGITTDEARRDLEALAAHIRQTRRMRLQAYRDADKRYFQ